MWTVVILLPMVVPQDFLKLRQDEYTCSPVPKLISQVSFRYVSVLKLGERTFITWNCTRTVIGHSPQEVFYSCDVLDMTHFLSFHVMAADPLVVDILEWSHLLFLLRWSFMSREEPLHRTPKVLQNFWSQAQLFRPWVNASPNYPTFDGSFQTCFFKPGCLRFLCKRALLRSFAPFCALLRSFAFICAFLHSFTCFCVRPRSERQRLGTTEFGDPVLGASRLCLRFSHSAVSDAELSLRLQLLCLRGFRCCYCCCLGKVENHA